MAIICFTLFVPKPSSTYRFGGVNGSLQKKELSQTLRVNKEKQVFSNV